MGIVKIERKLSRRRAKASRRRVNLKNQSFMPVIKKVDVEELKAQFDTKAKPAKEKKETKAKKEEVAEEVKETVAAEAAETSAKEETSEKAE